MDGYLVQSCLDGETGWQLVDEKKLQHGEELGVEENVDFPLRFSNVETTCQYRIMLHYVTFGDVKSEICEAKVHAVGE